MGRLRGRGRPGLRGLAHPRAHGRTGRDPRFPARDALVGTDRSGQEIQLALFFSYGSNPPLYPKWQEYLRKHQPPTLIVWGKNDQIFPAAGAFPYKRDLKNLEFHLLDTDHFALEEEGTVIATLIRDFLGKQLTK